MRLICQAVFGEGITSGSDHQVAELLTDQSMQFVDFLRKTIPVAFRLTKVVLPGQANGAKEVSILYE